MPATGAVATAVAQASCWRASRLAPARIWPGAKSARFLSMLESTISIAGVTTSASSGARNFATPET